MMANAFKTTISGLEKELEGLITDNQIQVRLLFHDIYSALLLLLYDWYFSRGSGVVLSGVISQLMCNS